MTLLASAGPTAAHSFWDKAVALRGEALHMMRPAGWLIVAVLFMVAVLALMRAAGKADRAGL